MGSKYCTCLAGTESISYERIERKKIAKKLLSRKDSIAMSTLKSFSGIVDHKVVTKNNKYFHPFPNNGELTDLINDRKLKITAEERRVVLDEMHVLLEKAHENTNKYINLCKDAEQTNLRPPKLLIEVISGHDINLTKWKKVPFIEVIQNDKGLMQSFHNNANMSDRLTTDQLDSINTSFGQPTRNTIGSQNSLVLSTDIPISPNEDGVFEWCRFYTLIYDADCEEKERSITVNLFRTKKNKNKCDQIGKSKTFFLNHMKHQECKQISLEFKDGYDETCNGIVNVRFQYIHNERTLFKQISEKYQEQEDLLEKFIRTLSSFKTENRETSHESAALEESNHSQKAGFYSYVDEDSVLGTPQLNSPDKRYLAQPPNYMQEFSYDVTSNELIAPKDEEEEKTKGVAMSLHPGW